MTDEQRERDLNKRGSELSEGALSIAQLTARLEALEVALRSRSQELRQLQRMLCLEDLQKLEHLRSGKRPVSSVAFETEAWIETHELTPAKVAPTLRDLWSSLRAPAAALPRGTGEP